MSIVDTIGGAPGVLNTQDLVAEIYAQSSSEGLLTQKQWDGLPSGNHVLWIDGCGSREDPPRVGSIHAMGLANKQSLLGLISSTGLNSGFVGVSWRYDPSKLVSVEMDANTGIFATNVITLCQTWCRLMYYDVNQVLLGEKSSFKQNVLNGTSMVQHVNHTRFECDFRYVPVGTVEVRFIPYIHVSGTDVQTTLLSDSNTAGLDNRLRVTVRTLL